MSALTGSPSPLPQATYRLGTCVLVSGVIQVNVDGNVIPARWVDPVVVLPGDPVIVVFTSAPSGQSEAIVIGRTTTRPRPATGTVTSVPGGSTLITVSTSEGSVQVRFGYASPTIGDVVLLSWDASTGTATSKIGVIPPVIPPAPPPPAAPPGGPTSGTLSVPAIDSATWNASSGGWNTTHNASVVQGSYGGSPNFTGSWFYGTSAGQLAGAAIQGIGMFIGARRRIGLYNNPLTLNLYVHTSPTRPGGDVGRIAGPHGITIPAGFGGGWVDIPLAWGPTLIAGGGISIAGNPYLGIVGRQESPQSGALSIAWAR